MPIIALPPYARLRDYETAIRQAGGEPRRLEIGRDDPADVIASVDGLLLPGGGDVDPALYGEARHPTFDPPEAGRDGYEIELARRAREIDMPILAICRGLQLLNVQRGGSLVQDIPDQLASPLNHRRREPTDAVVHTVTIAAESLVWRALGGEGGRDLWCAVNSRHHQAVKAIGEGLRVTATAPDGIVEAAEDPAMRFCVGVQWHPENFHRTGEFRGLFAAFVRAAAPM